MIAAAPALRRRCRQCGCEFTPRQTRPDRSANVSRYCYVCRPSNPEEGTAVCICHGEEMRWQKDPRYPDGGVWDCRIKKRERDRRSYAEAQGRST